MAWAPGTLKFKCTSCSWSAIHHYKSDAISIFAPPQRCPRCGERCTSSQAGLLDKIFTSQLKHWESAGKEILDEILRRKENKRDK